MGCLNHRRKGIQYKAEQKWDYIVSATVVDE